MLNMFEVDANLCLPCPDGFHVMDENEMSGMVFLNNRPGKCLSAPDLHILISIGSKKTGLFTAFLLNAKDVSKQTENSIRKAMLPYGYRGTDL